MIVVALVALVAITVLLAPARALAYPTGPNFNDSGYSYGMPYGTGNTGLYVRDAEGGDQIESRRGPHGGYSLTTRKCADCHSVHHAPAPGFLLLRGTTRWDPCDYCHTGGGGSKTNI